MLGYGGSFLQLEEILRYVQHIRRAPGQHLEDLDSSQALLFMKPLLTHFLFSSLSFFKWKQG